MNKNMDINQYGGWFEQLKGSIADNRIISATKALKDQGDNLKGLKDVGDRLTEIAKDKTENLNKYSAFSAASKYMADREEGKHIKKTEKIKDKVEKHTQDLSIKQLTRVQGIFEELINR